ncbi:MAG TPA: coproporphyrinogen III oxidase, partial [Rhodobiaceae bacterium]|nr:coproporphyrinogen III oxidase [Rhodobiaceae bacterium]
AFTVPDEDQATMLYDATQSICADAGLNAYEVSNHAKVGAECRHNLTYWRYGDYVGVGPGAHGRVTKGGVKCATVTERMPSKWLALVEAQDHGLVDQETITPTQSAEEMMLMGLRLQEGVSLKRYASLSGKPVNADRLSELSGDGLLQQTGDQLKATPAGRLVLNKLLGELLA